MFAPEAEVWYENLPKSGFGDLLARNISVPGLSPRYPYVHCTANMSICQITTCEGEINAAATMMALVLSPQFDLSRTYFLLAGIAGVNPKHSTIGGVALAKYAVQVALQYEFDAREMPSNFTTGYVGYGTLEPNKYPTINYGTEVMEVNEALRDLAFKYASRAKLADNESSKKYRARYQPVGVKFARGWDGPTVVKCDAATSDVYYSGTLLGEAFENTTNVWTNGTGVYCMTAQEDNATLEVLLRMHVHQVVDFARVIVMRTGSNFDRPPPGVTAYEHLLVLQQNGFEVAIKNIYMAGIEIVRGIHAEWRSVFLKGVKPTNYVGDIWGTLGGHPDFGPGSRTNGKAVKPAV
ncbi:purine nucleoside permease [Podospora australis]|uniref:Purine nucleoside permease n=1 Tax=Podospora australis TaxID=1536484 RepID=A0AAN6WJ11_9PEZI|nr:purine nucleoside permease [Podospora australis]